MRVTMNNENIIVSVHPKTAVFGFMLSAISIQPSAKGI